MSAYPFLFVLYLSLVWLCLYQTEAVDPTVGFISMPLNESNFIIQRPYDVPQDQRYSYVNGVHKLWVFKTDKPHSPTSRTNPRTEIRIQGYDYSSGVWQFEGYGYVPHGTSGACIMQVFGASPHATTLMLRTYNGESEMQIRVKCSCGEGKCREWSIVELQGVVEVQPAFQDRLQNLQIGLLCRPSSEENYTFTVGYHELTGSKVPLKKPLLVLKKTRHSDADQNGDLNSSRVELEVIGIIRHRILFKTRPKALISRQLPVVKERASAPVSVVPNQLA